MGMSRQQAIKIMSQMIKDEEGFLSDNTVEAHKMAIKALEQEPSTKNDCETCVHNKGVLECDMYGCKYEPTTKNDLGVDCISRQLRPVIHANWLSGDCKGAHCSNCEEYTPFVYGAYNFCPNCGADMREVEV